MNSFRNIFIVGIAVLALVFGMIIYHATGADTVDFSGEIISVEEAVDGTVLLRAEATFSGDFIFEIDRRSLLVDIDGKRISVDDLSIGDQVLIRYRRHLLVEDETKTVIKELRLFAKTS